MNNIISSMKVSNIKEDIQGISHSNTYESTEISEKNNKDMKTKKKVSFFPTITYINIECWKKYNEFQSYDEDDNKENYVDAKKKENNKDNTINDNKLIIKK